MVLEQKSYREWVATSIPRIGRRLISGGYSVLAAAALLPILVEHMTDQSSAYGALASLLGGIGGNLIANIAQGAYDKARSENDEYDIAGLAAILEKQMQTNDEISKAMALLVHKSGAVNQAFETLQNLPEQWEAFATRLLNQVKDLSGTNIIIDNLRVNQLTVIPARAIPSAESLVVDYLRLLAEATDLLRLGTIDPKFEIDSPIKLSQVYVHPRVQETKAPARVRQENFKDPLRVISEIFGKGDASGVVLVGGPGAGKTALIDRLANSLSLSILRNLQEDVDYVYDGTWQRQMPEWITTLVLPVRLSLQEFAARSLPADARQGEAGYLWEHIRGELRANALSDFAAPLNLILSGKMDLDGKRRDSPGSGGLILLDGLDEVPRHHRSIVEQTINEFSKRFNQSVVVVTCRTYSWAQRDQVLQLQRERHPLAKFGVHEIAPFSQEQISLFVERWYSAVRSLKHMTDETVQHRIQTLRIAAEMPSLVPLAERPLMLTLMATLHTSRGQLPQDRATLYADCVDLLLEVWQRAKDLHIGGKTTVEGGLLEEFGLSSAEVERVLRKIAYDLHVAGMPTVQQHKQDQEFRITAEQLRKAFRPLVGNSWDEAERLVSYLERRAGLLEYEGDEAYRFPHRTFQEFLAACYLLNKPDAPASLIHQFLSGPAWWGEVFSLAVGRQSHISYGQAVQILHDILHNVDDFLHTEDESNEGLFTTLLNTARDIGLADRQEDSSLYFDCLHRLIGTFLSHSSVTLDSRILRERGSIFADSSKVLIPHVFPLLENGRTGDAAAAYIGVYGSNELVPRLISLLEHKEASVRARAAHSLGGIRDPRAIDSLLRLSRDEDETLEVTLQALRALGRLGGDRAISALTDSIGHPDNEVRQVAVEELGRIGDEKAIYELCNRVEAPDLGMAQNIIHSLSAIGSSEAIECLIRLLDSEELSSFAEDALIEIGSTAIPLVREVYEKTDDCAMIEHCRYIISKVHYDSWESAWSSRDVPRISGPMLWREKDGNLIDQLSDDFQNDD